MLRPLPSRRPVHALLPLFALAPLAQLPPPGATVARIGVEAPVATQFVLRATVPVPKGVLVEQTPAQAFLDPGAVPLRVVDWNGAPATAQVSVVSRYPKDADGPDVVEVLARVRRNPSAPVGSLLQYDVVWAGAQSGSLFPFFDIHPKVAELVLKPGALLVRSQDVHGNWYFLDLLGTFGAKLGQYGPAEFLRLGPVLAQTRRYGVQDRVQGATPVGTPLPHALGVHAYLTARTGESTIALDLRFSNASSNLDPKTDADDPVGRLYLRQVELLVPEGWVATEAVTDSAAGAPYSTGLGWTAIPLVEPLPGGKLHLFPPHCQFHRRLVVAPAAEAGAALELARGAGLGFARKGQGSGGAPLWSWWNPATARYLPQRQRLPELDHLSTASLAQALADEESAEAWLIETGSPGSFPSLSPALGWALPIGVPYGGATSGEGILFYDGVPTAWAASRAGFRVLEMRHRREMDRHPNVYFDADGSPTTIAEWTEVGPSGPYFPVQFYMKVVGPTDPFGWKSAPTTQADLVANLGLEPDYEDALLAYEPHDLQHLVRATHTAKALVWLANDQLAKDDLLAQAALAEMTYSALPNSPNSGVTTTSMLGDVEEVLADPGVGFSFGRGEGWAVDTLATGFALASPAWRAARDAWFQQLVELVEFGQATCSGFLQAQESSKLLDGKYRTRQAYEQGIVEHALQGVWASALVDRKPTLAARLSDVLERSHYSLVHPLSWSTNPPGPHGQRAVGPLDESLPLYCSSLPADGAGGGIDAFQCWSSFAYAYARTGDPLFLTRAEEMLGGPLLPKLESKALENIENRAALIALAKALAP